MPDFSRDEIQAAFDHRMKLQDEDDWDGFGTTFTPDAVYVEASAGVMEGRDKILAWLIPAMKPCKGWTYPIQYMGIDGDRTFHKWMNRLPGQRADGSYYEFPGITVMVYAGNGQWSYQEDQYNAAGVGELVAEWAKDQGIEMTALMQEPEGGSGGSE
jgi:ketosteroid isomerase-like protein